MSKHLLADDEQTITQWATDMARMIYIVKTDDSGWTIADMHHPDFDIERDEPGSNQPTFLVPRDLVMKDITALMSDSDEPDDEKVQYQQAIDSNDLSILSTPVLARVIARVADAIGVIHESYVNAPKAREIAWDSDSFNANQINLAKITCPKCFMVMPLSGVCCE